MKAMILAAGRGERMRPLSDTIPKPLLEVNSKPLIIYHLEKLAKNGFRDIIINVAYLGDKIIDTLGDGSEFGLKITYSDERESGALESAGGIKKALDFFEDETFLVLNADIWCDYEFLYDFELAKDMLCHLILVPNPQHNQDGDFGLNGDIVLNSNDKTYTFAGIGYYNPNLFKDMSDKKMALAPLLRDAISKSKVSGEIYLGKWIDVGTPKRLYTLNKSI